LRAHIKAILNSPAKDLLENFAYTTKQMRTRPAAIVSALAAACLVFASSLAAQVLDPRASWQVLPSCTSTPVPDDHAFVATAVYQGDTLANVLVGSEHNPSTIVRVTVARGSKPISVFVSGYSGTIWDFQGDVERIRRVIALSLNRDRQVAVRGIPGDRVEFPDGSGCQLSPSARGPEHHEAHSRAIEMMFGRRPDRIAYEYAAHEIALPDAEWRDNRNARGSGDAARFYPGGFRELDPNTLVSPLAVTVPETFPDVAGLLQLERSGAIRKPQPAEVQEWVEGASRPYRSKLSPNYRLRMSFDYAITRDVMLPAGLHGAHSKKFLVLAGVPAPRGQPGHSCVAFMDGYRVGNEMICHGDERSAIERLRTLPAADALQGCRLLDVPADAAIEAVSAYEPDGAVHSGGSKRIPAPISVRVRKPGNVILVLNAYEPAIWRVSFTPDTRIVGVLLGGYYKSELEGVHPDTTVIATSHDGATQRPKPERACAPFYGYLGTAYQGGPDALLLDRQVEALTGRNLDGLRGAYRLKDVEIR
jgi:hypothetical protein